MSSSNDRTVRLWDIISGRCLRSFEFDHEVFSADISLTGTVGLLAVSLALDGVCQIRIVQVDDGAPMETVPTDTLSRVRFSSCPCGQAVQHVFFVDRRKLFMLSI